MSDQSCEHTKTIIEPSKHQHMAHGPCHEAEEKPDLPLWGSLIAIGILMVASLSQNWGQLKVF